MDKLSMEELGYFLYMQEMERQQQAAEAAAQARILTQDRDDEEKDEG